LWSKYDWAWNAEGDLYYCQSTFDAETEADALAAESADADDMAAGCGGFSWSEMRETSAIHGDWTDNWGGRHDVSSFSWNDNTITQNNNDEQWAVAQNGASSWSPGLWSKYDWAWNDEGELYYCQSTYNAETEEDALAAESADADDLVAGCGGFSWSEMRETIAIHGDAYYDYGEMSVSSWSYAEGEISLDVAAHDNDEQWFVVDLGGFEGSAGFMRIDWAWTEEVGVSYYICAAMDPWGEAPTDVESALDAWPSDATDMAAGCRDGGPWVPVYSEPIP
jgi:hypothetical protein